MMKTGAEPKGENTESNAGSLEKTLGELPEHLKTRLAWVGFSVERWIHTCVFFVSLPVLPILMSRCGGTGSTNHPPTVRRV